MTEAAHNRSGAARRYPASSFPQISRVRLAPAAGEVTLINMSSSGVLCGCNGRMTPGMAVTVKFEGSFSPSCVGGHVARCEVAGIGQDGLLNFHVGVAFVQPITLDEKLEPTVDAPAEVLAPPVAPVEPVTQVGRNRW